MKNLMSLLAICILFTFSSARAQDIIVKKNGEIIPAKVEKVLPEQIEYHKESNPDGPLYAINRCEIKEIRYKNGSLDAFPESCSPKKKSNDSLSNFFAGFEGRAGIFGLFNINDTGLTTSRFSFAGTPSFMWRLSNLTSIGAECMLLWGQADTDDPIRFIINPNIKTMLHFPVTRKTSLELIAAGGFSIWPDYNKQGELHETFLDLRTGWNTRVAFGMDYRITDKISLTANAGYSVNSSVSGDDVWITHDMMTLDLGVRYHIGKIMFDKNK